MSVYNSASLLSRKRLLLLLSSPAAAADPEPEDEAPERDDQEGDNEEDRVLDEEDDDEMEEIDAPRAPFEIPAGYLLAASPPTAEQLTFKHASAVQLVGKYMCTSSSTGRPLAGALARSHARMRMAAALSRGVCPPTFSSSTRLTRMSPSTRSRSTSTGRRNSPKHGSCWRLV